MNIGSKPKFWELWPFLRGTLLSATQHKKKHGVLSAIGYVIFQMNDGIIVFPLFTPVYLQDGIWPLSVIAFLYYKQQIKQRSLKSLATFYE